MKARDKGRLLRRKHALTGRVDARDLAERMGMDVFTWPLPAHEVHETMVGRSIAVSDELTNPERRWAIAHAIGHRVLHPGNAVWARAHTLLENQLEREAEEFSYGLLVDEAEVLEERLGTLDEVAEHFGVPADALWQNAPESWGQTRLL